MMTGMMVVMMIKNYTNNLIQANKTENQQFARLKIIHSYFIFIITVIHYIYIQLLFYRFIYIYQFTYVNVTNM